MASQSSHNRTWLGGDDGAAEPVKAVETGGASCFELVPLVMVG